MRQTLTQNYLTLCEDAVGGVNAASMRTESVLLGEEGGGEAPTKKRGLKDGTKAAEMRRLKFLFFIYAFIFRNLIAIRYLDALRILAIRERK